MVLKGSVDVQAPLVNNAYVVADNADEYDGQTLHWLGDLILSSSPKSGSGD